MSFRDFSLLWEMKGGSLYISLSNGLFSIKYHSLVKIFLRLGADGLYCMTKGINPFCTFRGFYLRWLHTVSHQFQQTNIHNFFDDFQDIDLHFTREKLQKQLA